MFILLCCLILSIPNIDISTDGLSLYFSGDGTINQNFARSKGNYQKITKVEINGPLTLDANTFESFSSMKSILMSDDIIEIKKHCFKGCSSLEQFTFPINIKAINQGIFSGCTNLHTVRFNTSVQTIDSFTMFFGCNSLTKFEVSLNNPYFSTDDSHQFLLSKDGTILYFAPSVENQTIPASVTEISSYCYYGLKKIKNINFNKCKLKIVKTRAFNQLNLKELVFPPTLERVESTVFYQSTIKNIFFPASLKYFHKDVLQELNGLENLTVENSDALINRKGVIMDANETIVFFIDSSISLFEVQSSIEYVEVSQVRSTHITSVNVLPGNQNFSSPDGILYNKKGTKLVVCPGGKKSAVLPSSCQTISDLSFKGCLVETVQLNEGLTSIGFQVFYGCKNLKSINMPNSLQKVGYYVLCSTPQLAIDLKFGPNIIELSDHIFYLSAVRSVDFSQCTLLKRIPDSLFINSEAKTVILPPNVQTIDEKAFESSAIESIELPDSTQTLMDRCFYGCKNLTTLDMSNTKIITIEDSCFEQSGLESISLPATVETISTLAFASLNNLKSIQFAPQSKLKTIAPYIIENCKQLKTFKITSQVSNINDGAFANSHSLQNFEIEENKYFSVDKGILYSKDKKTLVAFPGGRETAVIDKGVTSIQVLAFAGCIYLKSVSFDKASSITSLGMNTFLGCTSLEEVKLPGSLSTFDSTTFSGCTNIRSVSFEGESALSIVPSSAFKGFSKLEYFEFHPNIKTIGDSAFEGSALSNFTLYNATKIGSRAFFGSSNLVSVKLFASLEMLGASAFGGCRALKAFSYCGETVRNEAVFKDSGLETVFVREAYKGEKFGGVTVLRILDGDCHMPTLPFTVNSNFCLYGMFCLQNVMTSDE